MSSGPGMPDMSDLLQNVLGNLPGMENLPASEKKKMKKAIKATTEKVQSLDLESIFKTALEGDQANAPPQTPKKSKHRSHREVETLPPPPPEAFELTEKKKKKKKHKKSSPPPRTPDKEYNINLSLEELYKGETNKKLTVRVQRRLPLTDEDRKIYKEHSGKDAPEDGYKYDAVKIKHPIGDYLIPGMMEDEVITFSGQADEEEGHITGDIVAEIVQDKHDLFEREGNDLWILNKSISLRESYRGGFKFAHLDGRIIQVLPAEGEPLHFDGGLRRIPNAGMPVRADPEDLDDDGIVEEDGTDSAAAEASAPTIVGYGDLYIQFDLDLPETLSQESIDGLSQELSQEFPVDPVTQELITAQGDNLKVHEVTIEKVDDPYGNDDLDDDDDESGSDEEDSDEEEISGEETDESCSDDEETGSEEETDEETGSEEDEDEEEETDEQKAMDADAAAIELLMEEQQAGGGGEEEALEELARMKNGKSGKKKTKRA